MSILTHTIPKAYKDKQRYHHGINSGGCHTNNIATNTTTITINNDKEEEMAATLRMPPLSSDFNELSIKPTSKNNIQRTFFCLMSFH